MVKASSIQVIALAFTGIVAIIGMLTLCVCALYKIYIEPVMMIVLSNITVAAVSSFTTLLVGRTVSQLNQNSEVKNQPQIDEKQL
jgi:hypothetical protein